MGMRDGAANGLRMRLENVGVRPNLAFAVGQVAYLAAQKIPTWIAPPVVPKSEVTWLVSQYEKQLRETSGLAAVALIQGLCSKIFGSNGEAMFIGSYPEFAPDRWQQTVQQHPEYSAMAGIMQDATEAPSRSAAPAQQESRTPLQIPDVDALIALPAFEEEQNEMVAMFEGNGNTPDLLWPLMDQYLQPLYLRYPLRAYMTDGDVSGSWLVERYVAYMAKTIALMQLSNHFHSVGALGEAENEGFRAFILKTMEDYYALIMCAVERNDKEKLVTSHGEPCELEPLPFMKYSAMLVEIVEAEDANDPRRLLQQFGEG